MDLTETANPTTVAAGTHLGPVHIAVTDGEKALAVWRDLVGLTVIDETPDAIRLGAGGRTLIVLHPGAERPVAPNTSGLYHVAIHVPTRKELARVTARLMAARFRNSPTDHLVSEAVYLWDLDGNGIEMTFETPWRGKLTSDGDDYFGVTVDGRRHSGRDPIDLKSLLSELSETDSLTDPLPAGTRIGHVHVHVADLAAAMAFYSEAIGFRRLMLAHRIGMGDVTMDYPPHIVAFNIWAGVGAQQAPPGSAGLRWFTIVAPTDRDLAAMRQRLVAAKAPVGDDGDGIETRDPAGNRLRVEVAA
jgi:catechol 2,3-dioxygenase